MTFLTYERLLKDLQDEYYRPSRKGTMMLNLLIEALHPGFIEECVKYQQPVLASLNYLYDNVFDFTTGGYNKSTWRMYVKKNKIVLMSRYYVYFHMSDKIRKRSYVYRKGKLERT